MRILQLDPQSIALRARASSTSAPSLNESLLRGMLGFTLVSVSGFAPWALAGRWLQHHLGEVGLYAVCLLVFLGLSGPALHRLLIGPGSLARFSALFACGFSLYAAAWTSAWMLLGGHAGSLLGLGTGTALLAATLAFTFGVRSQWAAIFALLFTLNSGGYFLGGLLANHLPGISGKLLWGLCYGLGFGAGLGSAFFVCQSKARSLLNSAVSPHASGK